MIGKIVAIYEDSIKVRISIDLDKYSGIIGTHVKISDNININIGEIQNIESNILEISLVGQIVNNKFMPATLNKPSFSSVVELIDKVTLDNIVNKDNTSLKLYVGTLPLYKDYQINVNLNEFLSNHFAIFGNTGSGKSSCVARLLQNIFMDPSSIPLNANVILFDAYGEYKSSLNTYFKNIDSRLNFKSYTTSLKYSEDENLLRIPIWLLGVDDFVLLLNATESSQIYIIEKSLKLVNVFARDTEIATKHKNDIVARALLQILGSGKAPAQIRDQIFSVLTAHNTEELNLQTEVAQPGYVRTLRQCFNIDENNKINEIQLINEFLTRYLDDELKLSLPDQSYRYTLEQLLEALDFALISEGILKSNKVYDYANILRVRLNSIISSNYKNYFDYPSFITKEEYINEIVTSNGNKAQIINFNISHVDDRMAKNIVKIYSKLLFNYAEELENRATRPFHIIVEEAHRYIQNDTDINILGYNIFDRITKEGRKYGIVLGLISQRPSEISETAVSQCTNFLIFRTYHPKDITYVKEMVPNVSENIVKKLKTLHPGNCVAFGAAFNLPFVVKIDMPNPAPMSFNCDVSSIWFNKEN